MAQEILQRIAAGDQSAVADCMDRYGDLIWSLARRFLRGHIDAEDAVQDVFIEIWSSAARFDPSIASEVAFVSTIARRRLIDRIRKIERRPAGEPFDEFAANVTPEGSMSAGDHADVQRVAEVMQEMDPKQQEILAMSVYEGYSHSEIADRLSMPLGTVKTKVRRGLVQIRDRLEASGDAQEAGA
jgi:RNA polymerase sigma-70 factor (ECF subfamily)